MAPDAAGEMGARSKAAAAFSLAATSPARPGPATLGAVNVEGRA